MSSTRMRAFGLAIVALAACSFGTARAVAPSTGPRAASAGPTPVAVASVPAPVACPTCWRPVPAAPWQWQLTTPVDLSVPVPAYDIDLFDNPASVVAALHGAGRAAVCYLDAGTWESWRPDSSLFPRSVLGRGNGWPGERWLDIRQLAVLEPIMLARLDLCRARGFDAVELDNVDGYANRTGFPLTAGDQLAYDAALANAAHERGLGVALKNDLEQVPELLPYFDWALDEQCFQYRECSALGPFAQAGKAVWEVEYRLPLDAFCPRATSLGFSSMRKRLSLGPWRQACP